MEKVDLVVVAVAFVLSEERSSDPILYCTTEITYPTNIGIVRGTVSVATIVVVNAGVEIWLL